MKHFTYSHIFRQLLTATGDLIFPPSPVELLIRTITNTDIPSLYQPNIYLNTTYLSQYTDKKIQATITGNKFQHNHQAAKILGQILGQWLSDQPDDILFIPIPLGQKRLRQRGHNQIETVIQACPVPAHMNTRLLKRSTETLPQSQLDKKRRSQNIKNAFRYTNVNIDFSQYSQVILIDDVVTTGSTLNEARATLVPHLPADIPLTCLALAH